MVAAEPRTRPHSRNGTGASLLPSAAAPTGSSTGSSFVRISSSNSHTGTSHHRLASTLWRCLLVCGVLYIAGVWHSGVFSHLPPPSRALATAHTSEHLVQPPQALGAHDTKLMAATAIAPLHSQQQQQQPSSHPKRDAAADGNEPTITHDVSSIESTIAPPSIVSRQPPLAAARTATPSTSSITRSPSPLPTRSLSPKEAFHARLERGKVLTATEAIALQALDLAARRQQAIDEAARTVTPSPADVALQLAADAHAATVKPMPSLSTRRRLKCIGWRATADCDPMGKRQPALDRSCVRFVDPQQSGYCEVEDRDTGERFRVMRRQCTSLHALARFRCFESWDFSNFAIAGEQVVAAAIAKAQHATNVAPPNTNGISMVIYPKLVPSAFAIVRTLRELLNCTLPIEMWYRTDEFADVANHAALRTITQSYGPVTFRAIVDDRATGFATKISALRHSQFDQVLFLDADNFPVTDPTFLFDTPEFLTTGALFWPDFWHPNHTIFNIHNTSLLWELVDLAPVDMFEQESGQLVIDRTRHAVALELVEFYMFHRPNHFDKFRLVWGDKDLFRLAWLKTKSPFHMIAHPPGVAGKLQQGVFCGMTMVQHDPQGNVLFLHRNAKKLTGRKFHTPTTGGNSKHLESQIDAEDPAVWTHMLQFKPTSVASADYIVDIYEGAPAFDRGQWCYGKKSPAAAHWNVFAFPTLPFASLETRIRAFAVHATEIERLAAVAARTTAPVQLQHPVYNEQRAAFE